MFGTKGKLKKLDPNKLPVYEIMVDEFDETGISLISLVEDPAIMMKGMTFNSKDFMSFKETGDKQIIIGPALIPNMRIYREDEKFGQYYVVFSAETIAKMVEKFNKYGSNRKINLDHSNQMVDAYITEDWIVCDEVYDKSRKYGFEVPVGTYMIMVKIEDTNFWNTEVKGNGKFGFSIEGLLGQQLISLRKEATIDDLTEEDLIQIFNEIKLESYSDYPDGVKSNAKRVLDWTEKNGWGSCGTPVGKQRANQLAKGEAISLQTIKRMYSYLSRHEADLKSSKSYSDGCGKLMYDSWGGKAALGWAHNKLKKLGEIKDEKSQYSNIFVADSSNVDRVKYFEDTKELVVKFNDGSYYTYLNVDADTFNSIIEGDATCRTSGQNEFGEWEIGKTPSVGAAIWKYLIDKGVSKKEGGSFYSNQFKIEGVLPSIIENKN
jgi:hypothetical protein